MSEKLTFNLEKINVEDYKSVSFTPQLLQVDPNGSPTKRFEQMVQTSFQTDSREIREFLENTFGIGFNIAMEHSSNDRTQLNKLIAKIAPTKKSQRTKLNYFQYRDLIQMEEFKRFIINHLQNAEKVKDQEKMFTELTYLELAQFDKTSLYQERQQLDATAISEELSILPDIARNVKLVYLSYLENDQSIKDPEFKILMNIVKGRQQSTSPMIYKYSSPEDVLSTNDQQIIKHFIIDIERWNNK